MILKLFCCWYNYLYLYIQIFLNFAQVDFLLLVIVLYYYYHHCPRFRYCDYYFHYFANVPLIYLYYYYYYYCSSDRCSYWVRLILLFMAFNPTVIIELILPWLFLLFLLLLLLLIINVTFINDIAVSLIILYCSYYCSRKLLKLLESESEWFVRRFVAFWT